MMRIYLDNCCFNRPFDDQRQIRIKLEAEAKLYIQEKIRRKELELVWSYILDHENQANPFGERKRAIQQWKHLIACAIWAKCEAFLTTDDHILKKFQDFDEINVVSPLIFMTSLEENDDN